MANQRIGSHERPIERLAFRPEEAAESLGVSKTTIYGAIKDGRLNSFKWGRATLIRRAELERLMDQLDAPQRSDGTKA